MILAVIVKRGSSYQLKTKGTGKTLGTHSTKAGAVRQERAIQAAKRAPARRKP